MDQIYDKDGRCSVCKGTNVCISCGGSGEHPSLKDINCPTCKGKGDCICHGQKKKVSLCDPEKEIESLKALCFYPRATKRGPLAK